MFAFGKHRRRKERRGPDRLSRAYPVRDPRSGYEVFATCLSRSENNDVGRSTPYRDFAGKVCLRRRRERVVMLPLSAPFVVG